MMIVLLSIDDYKIWIKNGDFNKPIYKIEYNYYKKYIISMKSTLILALLFADIIAKRSYIYW